jgi:hypothetical protein
MTTNMNRTTSNHQIELIQAAEPNGKTCKFTAEKANQAEVTGNC